ncbi:complex I NDUFA9 subunit family protein [Bradyrhizobium valentinum]|uniref:complex I NDUFA9 subunit family protein n=1 Tax=Bradyrhizobium valentinum TaxID=1518501 RepID=UPI0007C707CC|nr:complex I NDUFA9 subunit family protein [Bradyrhizobium valentinum]
MNGRSQTGKLAVVFGGTGFLGRRAVRHLRRHEFSVRVASRHPDRGRDLFGSDDSRIESIEVNIHNEPSIARAVAGAYGVVNAVSLYVERGRETFHSVHVEAAHHIAAQAQQAGVERLVHISGIGSDATSSSPYIRKRGEGESAVRAAFADATVVRPAVMFGPDDTFITTIITLLRRFPVYPMFGQGLTRLQPAYVEDVGEAIALILQGSETGTTFECGGPRVYSYKELVSALAREAGVKPVLLPVPFAAWHALSRMLAILPSPPITRHQVALMQVDNMRSSEMPGFEQLGISPRAVEDIIQTMLRGR